MRTTLGFGLTRCGGFLARGATVLAAVLTACLVIGTVIAPFSGDSYPAPFSMGIEVGYVTWAWQALVEILAFLVIGRLLIGGWLIMLGQRMRPADLRILIQPPPEGLDDAVATALRAEPREPRHFVA